MLASIIADFQHAITLLEANGDIHGKAICTSQLDIYKWHGSDDVELLYLSYRELGGALETENRTGEPLTTFERAASFRVISQADLERWTQAFTQVGRWSESIIGFRRLIEIEPRAEYHRGLEECERRVSLFRAWMSLVLRTRAVNLSVNPPASVVQPEESGLERKSRKLLAFC